MTFTTSNPIDGSILTGDFIEATSSEVDHAVKLATGCFQEFNSLALSKRSNFLALIANEIEGLGDVLIDRYCSETGYDQHRAVAERTRTVRQLQAFSKEILSGDWLEASIDLIADGYSSPRVDLRRIMKGLGPVVVFGASNFPLAYSTAGGDTASALAAGCPVIVKSHPYHAGTNQLVTQSILRAAKATGMPDGVFSSLNGYSFEVGELLVSHPGVSAVGFTGSWTGGKALYDLAAKRANPIPVFAEMGSLNPVIILSDAVKSDASRIAHLLAQSITNCAGQFCTKPGVILLEDCPDENFVKLLGQEFAQMNNAVMLHDGIHDRYSSASDRALTMEHMEKYLFPSVSADNTAQNTLLVVNAEQFINQTELRMEVFGPFSVVVRCTDDKQLLQCLDSIQGQLTCSVFTTGNSREIVSDLINLFEKKAGRIIFNGVPTGVTVCPSMTHGGPYPATTDSRFSAVGVDAMRRFLRPVTYQNFPEELLPEALRNQNILGIRRRINGHYTVESLSA